MYSAEQEFILRNGRVPAKKRTVKRPVLLDQLYVHLQALIDGKSQWLVVHGMPGMGKTQLTIDLLWDKPELVFGHFSNIFWLTDRNIDPSRVIDVATDALIMLSAGITDLETIPPTLQSVGQLLHAKLLNLQCSSKVLVTKNCCFLTTSTSREIFACVQNATYFEISSSNALEKDQLMQLAVDRKLPDITNAQVDMLAQVSGNNLAVIDKLLHIADGKPQIIPSLLHRLKFRPIRELSCTSQYQYPSMDTPLHLCFQMVDERITVGFENWTVFQPSQWISLDIVSLSWPIDLCGFETNAEVEGMVIQDLRLLVYNSLLDEGTKDKLHTELDGNDVCYRIHPLVHSYLLHSRPQGYTKFLKSLSYLAEKEEPESKLRHYYSQNQENLRKIEKNLGVMLLKQKQNTQEKMSKCDQDSWIWKCISFLASAVQRILVGAS